MGQTKVLLLAGNAGQGKSVVAVNLASALCSFGVDVLLVDGDVKTPKLGHYVGMPLVEKTMQGVLTGRYPLKDAIYRTPSGLKLLLAGLAEVQTQNPLAILAQLEGIADVVIVDVPNDPVWHGAKGEYVVVSQPDFPSILNLQKLAKKVKVEGVILNRAYGDESDLSIGNVQDFLGVKVLGYVPEERLMREALRHGYALIDLYPDAAASIQIKKIAAKLMNSEYHAGRKEVSLLSKLGLFS